MTQKHIYNENFRVVVASSFTKLEVFKKMNWSVANASYKRFERWTKEHNIDYSHFNPNLSLRGKTYGYRESDEVVFSIGPERNGTSLKKRLIKMGMLNQCSNKNCQLKRWLGQDIVLELDHINGNRLDNTLENLRLLCPNCHSQTPTFRSKNRKCKTPGAVV